MIRLEQTGNWRGISNMIAYLGIDAKSSGEESLKRFGLKLSGIVKKHISEQDLGWTPLRPGTVAKKVRAGYSTNILVETSTYFQSISSWLADDGLSVEVGIPTGTVEPLTGTDTGKVAIIHEYGASQANIPPRPLWRPSFEEAKAWHFKNNRPEQIFFQKILKRI